MRMRGHADYAKDMLEAVDEISEFIGGMDFAKFSHDKKTLNATIRSLEVLGEAAKKIPPSTRSKHPSLPWKEMAGMRDKLSHEYFGVDVSIVWKVATEELPPLRKEIEKMAKEAGKQEKLRAD